MDLDVRGLTSGAGMLLGDALSKIGVLLDGKYEISAIDDSFAEITASRDIYSELGLSAEALFKKMCEK